MNSDDVMILQILTVFVCHNYGNTYITCMCLKKYYSFGFIYS